MMARTPGPWFVHDFSDVDPDQTEPCVTVSCVTPDHLEVCCMGRALTSTRAEMLANARLVAAAPDLLAFAENALAFAKACGDDYGAQMAQAVIVKAKGGAT